MKTTTLRTKYTKFFFVGNDLVNRCPTILQNTTTSRAFVARFHPNAIFEDGFIVLPAVL